jgi:hypothetical protein
MELAHQPEYVVMGISYVIKIRVFPKLITISDLYVHIPVVKVMTQGVKESVLIVGKVVGPAVVTPVTIAEEDDL